MCHLDLAKCTNIHIKPLLSHLWNWCIKAKLAGRIVLLLQGPQTVLAPCLTPIQLLRRLISIGIIDVRVYVLQATGPVENMAKLVAQLDSLEVEFWTGGRIGDEWGGEEVLTSEGESTRVAGNRVYSLHGVALKHEDRLIEGRGSASGVCEHVVCLLLG